MGSIFKACSHFLAEDGALDRDLHPVRTLAVAVTKNLLSRLGSDALDNLSHLIVSTSGPDQLSPSLGQDLRRIVGLPDCLTLDLIQGCSGGAASLIAASQLVSRSQGCALVVSADAARQSTSPTSPLRATFRDAAFACLIEATPSGDQRGLISHFCRQFTELTDVVQIPIGHSARSILHRLTGSKESTSFFNDPNEILGFQIDNQLVNRMLRRSTQFIDALKEVAPDPDIVITHYPNSRIADVLKRNPNFRRSLFADLSVEKNCGAATTGIGLSKLSDALHGKKLLLGGFESRGAVTCGYWQC